MFKEGRILRSKSSYEGINHVVKSEATDKFAFGSWTSNGDGGALELTDPLSLP